MLPLVVVVVVVRTWCLVVVVMVMVKGMMIRIRMILDPGFFSNATSNREHNLLLSRLLLPY